MFFSSISLLIADEPLWRIALPNSPTVTEKTAADELQSHINLMTGTEFPICSESEV